MVDYHDQISLVESVSNKDPAMVKTVEIPSAVTITDVCDNTLQRTEAGSHWRNSIPTKMGKARDIADDSGRKQAGDSYHEKGGTQKLLSLSIPECCNRSYPLKPNHKFGWCIFQL